jgi:hypothetical protein
MSMMMKEMMSDHVRDHEFVTGSIMKSFSKLVSDIEARECETLQREIEEKECKRKELNAKISSMDKHLKTFVKNERDRIDKVEATLTAQISWIRCLEKRKREEIERAAGVLSKRKRRPIEEKKQQQQSTPSSSKKKKETKKSRHMVIPPTTPQNKYMNDNSDIALNNDTSDVDAVGGGFMDEFSAEDDAVGVESDGEGLYF